MGITLQRKDKTSIFCPQPIASNHTYDIKTRFIGLVIALSIMFLGSWIIINLR